MTTYTREHLRAAYELGRKDAYSETITTSLECTVSAAITTKPEQLVKVGDWVRLKEDFKQSGIVTGTFLGGTVQWIQANPKSLTNAAHFGILAVYDHDSMTWIPATGYEEKL